MTLFIACLYYNVENNVIFDGNLTKWFEFDMEENEMG